ncbi:hypothetical protein [Acinetobacter bereziniae]|uniref:hypothetical protein n=1 Tax=Acinetobacter bereziniae TaxID=106648 RepID=UPI00125035A0|nr:hypothetical protein [Acinetobacter bereziniae]MCU4320612.1 hypothetical protein [Acinetobacter bereziniae]
MGKIQGFSIDSEIPFDRVLKLPFHILDDYYDYGAWNIKKPHVEEHAQMKASVIQLLQNIHMSLKKMT